MDRDKSEKPIMSSSTTNIGYTMITHDSGSEKEESFKEAHTKTNTANEDILKILLERLKDITNRLAIMEIKIESNRENLNLETRESDGNARDLTSRVNSNRAIDENREQVITDRNREIEQLEQRGTYQEETNNQRRNYVGNENLRIHQDGWLTNPFEGLTFSGQEDKTHPLKFIQDFEDTAEYEKITNRSRVYYFKKCLRDEATAWVELYDFRDYEEILYYFEMHYWGTDKQNACRDRIYNGRFTINRGTSVASYFLRLNQEARWLNYRIPFRDIVRNVRKQFPHEVQKYFREDEIKNIEEATRKLNHLEKEHKTHLENKRREEEETSRRILDQTIRTVQRNNYGGRRWYNREYNNQTRDFARKPYNERTGYQSNNTTWRRNFQQNDSGNNYSQGRFRNFQQDRWQKQQQYGSNGNRTGFEQKK